MEDPNELARKEERTDSVFKMFQSAFRPKRKNVYVWLKNNYVIGYKFQRPIINGNDIEIFSSFNELIVFFLVVTLILSARHLSRIAAKRRGENFDRRTDCHQRTPAQCKVRFRPFSMRNVLQTIRRL